MAWRILQFGALFAIGCTLESNSDSGFVDKAFETPSIDLSLKLVDPQDVVVARNQSALLKCQADSTQGPIQYTWLHYGKKILENDTNRIIQKNGDLYIPKVYSGKTGDIEYVGEYRCLVRNKVGALLSNVAKLKIASLKEFSADPVNSTVHLYQPKILRCGIHSTPPVDIQWEFNNNLILPHQTSYVPLPNGVMLIQKSQISHSGKYRCKASNDKLNKTKYSKVAYMTVLPQLTESTVPSFLPLDISPNVTVLIGDKLTLYCPVMGWPIPIVQWLFHGDVVGNASILEIPKVQNSNGGSYICRSYNKMGSISQNFNVLVRQMPNFVVKPISKLYPAAITARLDCSATGIPEPTIKWLKDGQILKFDSRIRAHAKGIIFSHTFTNDSGMYQCVATNSVGKVWAAVQIDIINVSLTPSPPQKLRCRPYNTSTICLSWKSPANISVTAYSIHSLYKENGVEVVGPDYVRNVTSMDADRLNSDTEYTFYVRLYAPGASDPSEKVTCRTGIFGNRNLDIENKDNTSVILKWSELTTDVSCTGERYSYRVQWKSDLPWSFFSNFTKKKSFLVTGLTAGVEYNFRVVSTNKDETELGTWTPYIIPDPTNSTNLNETNTTSEVTPVPPMDIKAVVQSASTIKLRWSKVQNTKFFTVCYAAADEKSGCEDKNLVKSFTNKIHIKKLKPNTKYEFRVRAHSLDGTPGYFSEPIYATTTADVPPPVTNLEYKVINDTSIYLQWRKPKETSSKIKKYIITYSPDNIWPVENWINITLSVKDEELVDDDDDTVSTILGNLDCDNNYTVLVRAVSDVGVSRAMVVLHVTTKTKLAQPEVSSTDVKYKQKVGLIVGTIIALLCIVCCIACILVRRRCVKRRTMERSRMTTSNNYYPAVAHYASQIGSVQVRLEETCNDDELENQFLVSDRITTNIPTLHTDNLDTKGGEEFPNSHSNGSAKPYMNGHVHITENPQFYPFSCNGQGLPVKLEKLTPLRYEEDPNSNVKPSKFYDLHKLFENSKKLRTANHHQCNPHFGENEDIRSSCDDIHSSESSRNVSLNGTQMTSLNDTTLNTTDQSRRKSPILGPNG
ncbi:immunoglobulin superfamily DCC subclass member 3-like [Diorhabda sublineata]|uniref:immunoglobulin superfamily DCC subclass member 3-like n=1 Tax=Diorhabda sublineata TaxID=1163346 RepID=UPI0024E0F5B5|nr:immunoglobulin superfamily DCC subclass member 3-like [Diorhabda sublineata]